MYEILRSAEWTDALDPGGRERRRLKRSSSARRRGGGEGGGGNSFPERVSLQFQAFGETFKLQLKRNPSLLASNFRVQEEEEDASQAVDVAVAGLNCFYQGSSALHPNSSAAVSLCDGVVSAAASRESFADPHLHVHLFFSFLSFSLYLSLHLLSPRVVSE